MDPVSTNIAWEKHYEEDIFIDRTTEQPYGFKFVTREARMAPVVGDAVRWLWNGGKALCGLALNETEDRKMYKKEYYQRQCAATQQTEIFHFRLHKDGRVLVKIQDGSETDSPAQYGVLNSIGAPDCTGSNKGEKARIKLSIGTLSITSGKMCDRWIYYNRPESQFSDNPTNKDIVWKNPMRVLLEEFFMYNNADCSVDLKIMDPLVHTQKVTGEVKNVFTWGWRRMKRAARQTWFGRKFCAAVDLKKREYLDDFTASDEYLACYDFINKGTEPSRRRRLPDRKSVV